MLFNRQGVQQKNWRMVKKGKQILFGCSLFFVVGGMSISSSQVTYASDANSSEVIAKQEKNNNLGEQNSTVVIPALEKQIQSSNKKLEKTTVSEDNKKLTEEKEVKEVNKKELKDLVDKIKKTDISKKTEKSVKELNLILSRAEKALDNKEITQEEIDKEVKALKEAFEKLEDKPKEDKKSEVKEKDESKKDNKVSSEKDNKEKQEQNSIEDVARKHNEKITKVTTTVNEIHSIANQINYEFSESEKELVKTAEKLPTAYNSDKYNEETIQKLLKEVIFLRNKVANRMTRAHSGKRDPRNGQPINGNGESGFRTITITPIANMYNSSKVHTHENKTELTYYNSDIVNSWINIFGKREGKDPLVKYTYGENRGKEDKTPYYVKKVEIMSGLETLTGLKLTISYGSDPKNPKSQDITRGYWNVNNPANVAIISGKIGEGGLVKPGTYHVQLRASGDNRNIGNRNFATVTYTFHIKSQSERNEVRNLSTTYVDDVRHLTEAEKTALIEKFKTEHPNVVNRVNGANEPQVDFDHAEVSADGATMTIHFKDGFATKTIQTNAQNDAIAKHQSITALYGDPHDFYKNPRNLVKSKTGNELPSTVDVQWKTPFNLQQPGTRNAVVTVTYQNGTVKDVSTPYTVLDFVGKQDKRINQHQSGELGDARSYITLSNGTAAATDLTIRWKGGSTVDTSRPTIHRKQIEILRGNTVMKTVDIPVEIVDNIRPTVEIPYDNPGNQEIYLYSHENNNITLKAKDNNGKISKVYLAFPADNRQGLGQEDSSYLGGGSPDGLYLTATKIKSETTGSNAQPATITVSGNINNQPFTGEKSITRYLYTEDPAGNANYEHVGHANDNGAPGRIRFVWKPQTFKYTATANSQTQTVSYKEEPSAEASVNKTGLPAGTTYAWKTKPDTSSPGNKTGVVEVTYPDTSKDTVNVTVAVRKLSDEYAPTGNKIVRNQNAPVSNDELKAAVTINNNGNSKVKSVTPVGTISTTNAGTSTIKATVTYLDDTTDPVDIPLEVKDVTAPTIQSPSDRQNWDLIALDRTLPSITVTSVDNNGGTGVKSTTVTGLPDFLVYDNATNTIKFKNGVQEVTKLPVGQDSKTYTVSIQVTDNANNPSQRQFTITVKSMTTKYNATPNAQKQTVSYGATPDAGISINKNGLPAGTTYTWATTPSTTTGPGEKAGVVTVTYPDGSKDTVNVTVNVRALNDEYNLAATEIEVNQNDKVSNDRLKTVVSATSKVGNINGTDKISTVTAPTINTANYGSQNITATVTFKDGTVKEVTIPIKVKDVTKPTISAPGENTNWEMTALDKTLPPMEVRAEDNANGSGIKSISVTGLPDYLEYDKTTNSIKFKAGKQGVEKLPVNTPSKEFTLTIRVEDNAGNISERKAKITVYSMSEKNNPTPLPQEVDNGHVPNAEESVNKTGLPEGTTVTWKTTPDVSTPGSHPGVALVHYPDGTEDEVEVPVTVKKQSDTFNPTAKEPNQTVRHKEVPDPEKSINTNDLPAGTKYSWSEQPDTSKPGSKTGKVLITYPDKSTEEVTVTVNVTPQKDEYNPTAIAQEVDNGHVPNAEESVNKTGLPEGTTVTWKTTPDVSTPGSHPGVALVHYPDGTEDEVPVTIVVRQSSEKGVPETNDETPEFSGGVNPSDSPSLDIPEYTDPIGTSGTDGKGNTIEPPKVDIPEYTGPIGTSGTDGNGNTIEPPSVDVPEYTGPMGSSITDGNGNVIEPPIVNLAEFSGGVNGELGEQPDLPEFNGGVNGELGEHPDLPEFNGGANGMPEEHPDLPEFNGGVNGEPEVQPTQPEFNGGVNGMPEEQPELPNYNGRVAEEPNTRLNITSKVTTKRLANTGETQNNSELAGLGLAILGLFAAIKRRKNEEE